MDAQNGDLARRLEAALADRQAIKTQLSMLQAQIHGLQAEVQSLAAAAAGLVTLPARISPISSSMALKLAA